MVATYINKDKVLRYLGYNNQKIDKSIDELIDQSISETASHIKERYRYKTFNIIHEKKGLFVEGTNIKLIGEDIKVHLKNSASCIIMAATLGHEVDRLIRYYEKTSMTKAIIIDAIASAAIEAMTERLNDDLKKRLAKEKKALTSRYSPGYGDFPLTMQNPILDILEARKSIGLTSNQNNILIPRKSITAIIGIVEEGLEGKSLSCEQCNMKDNCSFSKGGVGCGY